MSKATQLTNTRVVFAVVVVVVVVVIYTVIGLLQSPPSLPFS